MRVIGRAEPWTELRAEVTFGDASGDPGRVMQLQCEQCVLALWRGDTGSLIIGLAEPSEDE